MSKGSSPRPFSVSNDEYAKRWDAIFGRDLDDKDENENNKQQDNKEDKSTEESSV